MAQQQQTKVEKEQEKAYKEFRKFIDQQKKDMKKSSKGGKRAVGAGGVELMTSSEIQEKFEDKEGKKLARRAKEFILGDEEKGNILTRGFQQALENIPLFGGAISERIDEKRASRALQKAKKEAEGKRASLLTKVMKVVEGAGLQRELGKARAIFDKEFGDKADEAFLDILINNGITSDDAILDFFLGLGGGSIDLSGAIQEQKGEGMLTGSTLTLGGGAGGGLAPSMETGLSTAPGGPVAGIDPTLKQELLVQTGLLQDILNAIQNPKRDKLQEREDKLEAEREANKLKNTISGGAAGGEGGDGGDGGDGGGLMSTITDMAMLLGGGSTKGGKPPKPKGRFSKIRNLFKGGGASKLGRIGRVGAALSGAVGGIGSMGSSIASTAGGWWSSIKSGAGSLWEGTKSLASKAGEKLAKLNPAKFLENTLKSKGGQILKSVLKIPIIEPIIRTFMLGSQISDIKSSGLEPSEKKKQIGTAIGSNLGAMLGSIGGGVLGSFIPIPFVGTALGAVAGDFAGSYLGGELAKLMGPETIYDAASSIPLLGDLIKVDDQMGSMTPNQAGGESIGGGSSSLSPTASSASLSPSPSAPILATSTTAQISSSAASAASSSGTGGGRSTNVIAPSSTNVTNNSSTTVANTRVAQSEATFMASQMMNGGVPRFG